MAAVTKDYSKIRFWLRVVEVSKLSGLYLWRLNLKAVGFSSNSHFTSSFLQLIFSLVVLITACVWIDALSTSNINFCVRRYPELPDFVISPFFILSDYCPAGMDVLTEKLNMHSRPPPPSIVALCRLDLVPPLLLIHLHCQEKER